MVFIKLVTVEGIVYQETYNYVCIIDEGGSKRQDSGMVCALLDATIRHFKGAHDEVTTLHLKSDNASNLKNELVVRVLKGIKIQGEEVSREPLTVAGFHPSIPGDGKDICDLCGAICNCKVRKYVNAGNDINCPRDQALAICEGDGVANCIVMLGPITGDQHEIKNKKIKSIQGLFDFEYRPDGVLVRRISRIGAGKLIKIEPKTPGQKFDFTIMNPHQLDPLGRPKRKTSNPLEKSGKIDSAGDHEVKDPLKQLTMMEHVRDVCTKAYGMDTIREFQPEVDIGGNALLQKLPEPAFSDPLLQLQSKTKWTPEAWTPKDLDVGHAHPIWGGGKNKKTAEAKAYIGAIFMQGKKDRPVLASEVERRMQEEVDPVTKLPKFDADSFLDEEQIMGEFHSRANPPKAKNVPAKKRKAAEAFATSEVVTNAVDESNGLEQQALDEAVQDMRAGEVAAALDRDANRIQNALEDISDSDECPMRVAGANLCDIAEELIFISTATKALTDEQKKAIVQKLETDGKKQRRLLNNEQLLSKAIISFVKKECPRQCGALKPYYV